MFAGFTRHKIYITKKFFSQLHEINENLEILYAFIGQKIGGYKNKKTFI